MSEIDGLEKMKENFSYDMAKRVDKAFKEGFVFGVDCGMSKREYFAGMALQGYLANPTSFGPPVPESDKYNPRLVADVSANFAYMLADAMLRAGKGEK